MYQTSYFRRVKQNEGYGNTFKEFKVYHPSIKELFGGDSDLPDYVITAHDIDPYFRVKMQGVIQKYIDSSISSTVNLKNEIKKETVADIYMTAHKAGLKGITVYREGSREGILITNEEAKKENTNTSTEDVTASQNNEKRPRMRPITTSGTTRRIRTGEGSLYITINEDENGTLSIGTELNDTIIQQIIDAKVYDLQLSVTNSINKGPYLLNTILNDKNNNKDEAITEIYKMLRPGEPPTIEIATQIFNNLFFSSDRYDLSDVGRVKMNSRLDMECSDKITILRNDDIISIIHKMLDLRDGKDEIDDIDHLGNRRVRSVGELVENQARIGVYRMERAIKEKMTTLDAVSYTHLTLPTKRIV